MRADYPEIACSLDDFYLCLVHPGAIDYAQESAEWQEQQREFAAAYCRETAQMQLQINKTLIALLKRGL